MKKIFILMLLTPWLSMAQPVPEGYIHIQSTIENGPRILLNDSVLLVASKTGSTSSTGYFTRINLNDLTWRHLGKLPENVTSMFAIAMADSLQGVILGSNGSLFYTEDGGASFTRSAITMSTPQTQTPVTLLRAPAGYLAYYQLSAMHHFYYSPDGRNFTHAGSAQTINNPVFVGDTLYYYSMQRIRISPDGGKTFPNQDYIYNLPQGANWARAVSHRLMFCRTQAGLFYRSDDGGGKWTEVSLPDPFPAINTVVFRNEMEGVIPLQSGNQFYYTRDGGVIWQKANRPAQNGSFVFASQKLWFLSESTYYTSDWGTSWEKIFEPFPVADINDVSFSGKLGILAFNNGNHAISHNGGYHFELKPAFTNQRIMAAEVLNDTIILARLFSGSVFRSRDKGNTWQSIGTRATNSDSYFKHNRNGRVITYGPSAFVSTDFGASFQIPPLSANIAFGDFTPSNQFIGVRPETDGLKIRRYSVPDYNFAELQTISGTIDFLDIVMYNNQTGYILGREGQEKLVTYKTTDGGSTWNRRPGITSSIDFARAGLTLQLLGEDTIAIAQSYFNQNVSAYNRIFYTTNGGQTWQEHELNNPIGDAGFILRSGHFTDHRQFFAGLRNGNLFLNGFSLKAPVVQGNGGGTTGLSTVSLDQVDVRVFPVPASEHIFIEFGQGNRLSGGKGELLLVDMNGRVAVRKVLDAKDALPVMLDIRALPQGMYMIRIQTDNNSGSARFVKK